MKWMGYLRNNDVALRAVTLVLGMTAYTVLVLFVVMLTGGFG